ncbi:antitoxin Xre/MbcA/ParS toxin-binding domain-containing protein [Pseudomonas shirazensis]|uniref:antitoxin Xre/MbcA/ParS toxin-binding domain-containing protein n=1 Tax=Pseudomonas shirazensis TaxID=2745494 RepID=UPI003D2DE2B4
MDYQPSILTEAERVFGDKQKAAVWMSQSRAAFGNMSALELASDRAGSQKVREELMRLKHGFAS